jgi:hypothetical protein
MISKSHLCDVPPSSSQWAGSPFSRGQLLIHLEDDSVVEVVARLRANGTYMLRGGRWVGERELEDPMVEGRRRDVLRGARRSARQRTIERGDFDSVFPDIAAQRRRQEWEGRANAVGNVLDGALALLVLALMLFICSCNLTC